MNKANRPNEHYPEGSQSGYHQGYPPQQGQAPQQGQGYPQDYPRAQESYPQAQEGGYQQPRYAQQGQQGRPGPAGPSGPAYAPQQQAQPGPQGQMPPQGNYPQGPARPKRQQDTEFKAMLNETGEWIKSFFRADFTRVVDQAKASKNQFTWAVMLLAYFLLLPIFETFVYLRYGGSFRRGFLQGLLVLLRGNLSAIAIFVVIAGLLTLSQLIFKEYDKWYVPLNAASAVMIPRVLFTPLSSILRLFNVQVLFEFEAILSAGILAISIFLFLKFMYPNREKKNAPWVMTAMLALAFILIDYAERIV